MVFSSISFLFYFLPLFFLIYYIFFCISSHKNIALVFFSFIFYSMGDVSAFPLLLVSVTLNYAAGNIISRAQSQQYISKHTRLFWSEKLWLTIGVLGNLCLLIFYKYIGFIFETLKYIGIPMQSFFSIPNISLPIGISFFTFHGISYLIDIYKRDSHPALNFFQTALYIAMFPHLVAGPIVRYTTVALQINSRRISLPGIASGIQFFMAGLSQKVLVANVMAEIADPIFKLQESQLSTSLAWTGAIAYTFQILFDFTGYSNMAIGLGLMMGFTFPPNFNFPYISRSMTDFWRRWHMSLSSWLRDYVYIPLGGNRISSLRTYFNLFIVFFICGLWHGANWTFIFWGCFHGILLIVERLGFLRILERLPKFVSHIYVAFMVVIGWVLFRCDSVEHTMTFLNKMLVLHMPEQSLPVRFYVDNQALLTTAVAIILSIPIHRLFLRYGSGPVDPTRLETYMVGYRSGTYGGICLTFLIVTFTWACLRIGAGSYNPFIYYRF